MTSLRTKFGRNRPETDPGNSGYPGLRRPGGGRLRTLKLIQKPRYILIYRSLSATDHSCAWARQAIIPVPPPGPRGQGEPEGWWDGMAGAPTEGQKHRAPVLRQCPKLKWGRLMWRGRRDGWADCDAWGTLDTCTSLRITSKSADFQIHGNRPSR